MFFIMAVLLLYIMCMYIVTLLNQPFQFRLPPVVLYPLVPHPLLTPHHPPPPMDPPLDPRQLTPPGRQTFLCRSERDVTAKYGS